MKHRKELKILYILFIIFSVYVVIIMSNIALPIVFKYISTLLSIFTPFIIGFFVAFLLHTLVDKIEEQGINRLLAVLLIFVTFILLIIYLISSLIPIVFSQVNELQKQIPQIYASIDEVLNNFWARFSFIPEKYHFNLNDVQNWTMDNVLNIRLSFKANNLLDSFNLIVLTPIIIFYFLYDYNRLLYKLKRFLLKHDLKFIFHFLREADNGVGAYFRGLILVMNLMAITSGIGFYGIGLKYPLLFGFILGYTNAIPIIGNYIGGIPVVFFALTQSWKLAILSLLIIFIVQTVEANIVTPYVQSKSISCHPLLILVSFVFFGKFFGFVGMIFAIPLLAIILLIIKYIRIYVRFQRIQKKRILNDIS